MFTNVKMVKSTYNVEKVRSMHGENLSNTILKIEVPKTRVNNNETGSSFQFSGINEENNNKDAAIFDGAKTH